MYLWEGRQDSSPRIDYWYDVKNSADTKSKDAVAAINQKDKSVRLRVISQKKDTNSREIVYEVHVLTSNPIYNKCFCISNRLIRRWNRKEISYGMPTLEEFLNIWEKHFGITAGKSGTFEPDYQVVAFGKQIQYSQTPLVGTNEDKKSDHDNMVITLNTSLHELSLMNKNIKWLAFEPDNARKVASKGAVFDRWVLDYVHAKKAKLEEDANDKDKDKDKDKKQEKGKGKDDDGCDEKEKEVFYDINTLLNLEILLNKGDKKKKIGNKDKNKDSKEKVKEEFEKLDWCLKNRGWILVEFDNKTSDVITKVAEKISNSIEMYLFGFDTEGSGSDDDDEDEEDDEDDGKAKESDNGKDEDKEKDKEKEIKMLGISNWKSICNYFGLINYKDYKTLFRMLTTDLLNVFKDEYPKHLHESIDLISNTMYNLTNEIIDVLDNKYHFLKQNTTDENKQQAQEQEKGQEEQKQTSPHNILCPKDGITLPLSKKRVKFGMIDFVFYYNNWKRDLVGKRDSIQDDEDDEDENDEDDNGDKNEKANDNDKDDRDEKEVKKDEDDMDSSDEEYSMLNDNINVEAHNDPGLFSLSFISSAKGLELLDMDDEWVSMPTSLYGRYGILWCGQASKNLLNFKPGTHRVLYNPKQARFTAWYEACVESQINNDIINTADKIMLGLDKSKEELQSSEE